MSKKKKETRDFIDREKSVLYIPFQSPLFI